MSGLQGAANVQGLGLGIVIGSQAVGFGYVDAVYMVLAGALVLLAGMLSETYTRRKEASDNGT